MQDDPHAKESPERTPARPDASRPYVTILFTDIVDSTRHWHELGDVETRYRIEQHNASLIPIVQGYDGRVVKTIGDSIMASFENPDNAVRAAIAMQHALHEVREKDPDFELKVRIGIHRGRAIIEDDDVYGNTVNVASRVEAEAKGDEILVSGSVAQNLDQERYYLSRRGSFTPRGKSNSILLYRVSWWRTECLLDKVPGRMAPARGRFGRSLARTILQAFVNVAGIAAAAIAFAPVWFAAQPGWQAFALNPAFALEFEPQLLATGAASGAVLLTVAALAHRGLRRALSACAIAWMIFAAVELVAHRAPVEFPGSWTHEFDLAGARWVEVRSEGKVLHSKPSIDAPVVARLHDGHRLPFDQRAETRRGAPWLRVAFAPQRYAWMPDAAASDAHAIVPAHQPPIVARDLYATSLAVLAGCGAFIRFGGRPSRNPRT